MANHAYEVWRDDLADLTEEVFLRKYGQSKQAMWEKIMGPSGRCEIRAVPNPEVVAHA